MKLRPEEKGAGSPFAEEVLARLPLAEVFYAAWAFVAPEEVLEEIFEDKRGHCYTCGLTFPEIVLVLASALTRHLGSGNRAIEKALEQSALSVGARAVF